MSQLEAAKARLTATLDRLEAALMPLGEARKRHVRDAAEIASLNQEREGLLARIAALEEENRLLANLAEEVEGRVDQAIADINAALVQPELQA
jgi:chromosome segregation ATPase